MEEAFHTSLGIYNLVWVLMAVVGLILLDRIRQTLKALHFIELSRLKRERPDVFDD
jgi:hypothetical protein